MPSICVSVSSCICDGNGDIEHKLEIGDVIETPRKTPRVLLGMMGLVGTAYFVALK